MIPTNKEEMIWSFVESLSVEDAGDNVQNPWREVFDDDTCHILLTRDRSRIYNLADFMERDIQYVLIGEAPGYQGARITGIPFVSERLLYEGGIPGLMKTSRLTNRKTPFSEPSATIVWRTLYELQIEQSTMLWNAFPWHPHKPGEPLSNRTPTRQEVDSGQPYIEALMKIYPNAAIIAVGQKSDGILTRMDIEHQTVRHPSMGGATKFRDQLKAIVYSE